MVQENIEQNKTLLGAFATTVFERKDLSSLQDYMREDYIQHNPLVEQGVDGFKKFFSNWFDAVPDWHYKLEKMVTEGDSVWVYGVYAGTQEKEWLGIPASNKPYQIHAVDIFRVEGGKLAEHWDVMDIYGLFKQLGALN